MAALVTLEREARLTNRGHEFDMPDADLIDILRHPESGKRRYLFESALACFQFAAEQHDGMLRMYTD
ncbi:MAG TPA: hypothetical protein VGD69_26700 [Herpetosiphonaceae bacterium]